jgi:hypothetical protein
MTEKFHYPMYLPWLSVSLVLVTSLLLWSRLPSEMIGHWSLNGNPDTNFLLGRGSALLTGLTGQMVIHGLHTWKISNSGNASRAGILLRECFAIGVIALCWIGRAVYNVLSQTR